jgi:hypothetical protein
MLRRKAIKFFANGLAALIVFVTVFIAVTAVLDGLCRAIGYYDEGIRQSHELGELE